MVNRQRPARLIVCAALLPWASLHGVASALAQAETPPPAEVPPAVEAADAGSVEPLTPEQAQAKRLGFYFSMSLEQLTHRGPAGGLGVLVDAPRLPGDRFPVIGPETEADFRGRLNLGMKVGFRLRNDHGRIELGYLQWKEAKDLRTLAPDGKAIANTLTSPDAGYFEDQGTAFAPGPPDGQVTGFESGSLSEGSELADFPLDGAEDVNLNFNSDFIRFATSDAIVGQVRTNLKLFDVDYVRTLKRVRRFTLDGVAGVRAGSLTQFTDVGYREFGAFGVYIDEEGCSACTDETPTNQNLGPIVDGDGDGETQTIRNENDGDGFLDGNRTLPMADQLEQVDTVSEDRIVADIATEGLGIKLGVNGRYEISRKLRLLGGVSLSALSSDSKFSYRETFVSERDRFLNFIEWDLNGDGRYDLADLDFDGDGEVDLNDDDAVRNGQGYVDIQQRSGAEQSVVGPALGRPCPRGVNCGAFDPAFGNAGRLYPGDPIPESDRNRDVIRETSVLADRRGGASGILPILDLNVGLEYQFSRFAYLTLGLRSTRWFDSGNFRALANDAIAGAPSDVSGDFGLDGYFFMLTVVPR